MNLSIDFNDLSTCLLRCCMSSVRMIDRELNIVKENFSHKEGSTYQELPRICADSVTKCVHESAAARTPGNSACTGHRGWRVQSLGGKDG